MTNSPWVLKISEFKSTLALSEVTVLNDFGAVAHAVARAPADQLLHVCGADRPLPERGTVSVIGPGTGLGVAHFHRHADGYHVQATEGGHIGFSPQDAIDDAILAHLRAASNACLEIAPASSRTSSSARWKSSSARVSCAVFCAMRASAAWTSASARAICAAACVSLA